MMKPLVGVRVLEFEGIGPGPLASRMLADMGAEVLVIVRPGAWMLGENGEGAVTNPMRRGKSVVTLDLKQRDAIDRVRSYVQTSDALIEGYRPGVMEKLGLGPVDCARHNPRVVYGRVTGWGQDGPLARSAGHDLNYVALTGVLSLSAHRGQPPIVPPTVIGDASGALGLAYGIVSGLLAANRSGSGCVVDCAIIDVVANLSALALWARGNGLLDTLRPSMFHDSPFYDVYECADGRFITLAAIEPQFYALLLEKLGLNDVDPKQQYDASQWPQLKRRFRALFGSQLRDYWCARLEGSDVCFAPVLSIGEAVDHPHNVMREIYEVGPDGSVDTTAAPRLLPLSVTV